MKSMTGFGKNSVSTEFYDIDIEIKSVNHRFLDTTFRMPSSFQPYEIELRNTLKSRVSRGSVTVFVNVSKKAVKENLKKFNEANIESYCKMMREVSAKFNIKDDVNWDVLFKFNDIFENKKETVDEDELLAALKEGLNGALDKMIEFRAKEGAAIKEDLAARLKELADCTAEIKELSADAAKIQFERLMGRLNKLMDSSSFNKERMEQELVVISDKVDISEEVSRMESHIKLFGDTLEMDIPVGQKLNFIAQEMHREANTTSSKTNLTDVSHLSVAMKGAIEKIREQVQNAE